MTYRKHYQNYVRPAPAGLSMLFVLACSTGCPSDDIPTVTAGDDTTTTDAATTTGITTLPTQNTTDVATTDAATDGMDTTSGETEGEDTTEGAETQGDTCGDGVLDDGEECDGDDLGGGTCADEGFVGGDLACNDDCTLDTSGCAEATCGDGMIEGDEDCEGKDLGGEDCISQGLDGGTLGCTAECAFDLMGCFRISCGDDTIQPPEVCDGADLGGADCVSEGFDGGTLACDAASMCSAFDTSGCFVCGDDTVGGAETCDGADLNGQDCVSQGFESGTLACNADCGGYDTSGCGTCGDDVVGGTETCDGADLGGETCITQGFQGGTLACNADCGGFDTSGCTNDVCGDGVISGAEVCDTADLGGATCASEGFDGGTLACAADCLSLDTSGCANENCGDGIAVGSEVCDGLDTAGADCVSEGFLGGTLGCNSTCDGFDAGMCYDGQTTVCSTPAIPIGPQTADPPAVDVINAVGNGAALIDVDVLVDATHTWSGDMEIDVRHVATDTIVRTFEGDCGNTDDMLVTYDDSAAGPPVCVQPVGDGGTGLPVQPLAAFFNLGDGSGDWEITINDTANGDGGTLNEWCVTLNTNSTAPVCGDSTLTSPPEVCDTNELGGTSCEDLGFAGGSLDCNAGCGFDTSECSDGVIALCATPGAAIVNGAPVDSTITLPAGANIADVDVFVDITHTWNSDLDIFLTHDDTGTQVELATDLCGADDDVFAFFNDEATGAPDCVVPVAIEGNVTAEGVLGDFDGEASGGNWTLNVTDDASGDDGTLNEWCIYITPEAAP